MENYFPFHKKQCQCLKCGSIFPYEVNMIFLDENLPNCQKESIACPHCDSEDFFIIKPHQFTPLESMMVDLQEHGQDKVWQEIETFNNPFHRIKSRRLFAEAMKKIKENNL